MRDFNQLGSKAHQSQFLRGINPKVKRPPDKSLVYVVRAFVI